MSRYPGRRFRSADPPCIARMDRVATCTSHDLGSGQETTTARPIQNLAQLQECSRPWPDIFSPCPDLCSDNRPIRKKALDSCNKKRAKRSFREKKTQTPKWSTSIRRLRDCRLLDLTRITIFTCYISILLSVWTPLISAAPHVSPFPDGRRQLLRRQAIPDKFGNTGNEPAPVASQPAPRPVSSSTSAVLESSVVLFPSSDTPLSTLSAGATTLTTTSNTLLATTTPTTVIRPSTAIPIPPSPAPTGFGESDGNANGPGEAEISPGTPPAPFTLTNHRNTLSLEAIAGLAAGGFVLLCILIAFGVWAYRRRPSKHVDEIPIRRSKLASRLGFRIFGNGFSRSASRSSSRRGSSESHTEKDIDAGRVDKGSISMPKNAWLENGLLSVPKPAFLRDDGSKEDTTAPWVQKEDISEPRPGRPASAEPLGRLSGMGMGMGYLK